MTPSDQTPEAPSRAERTERRRNATVIDTNGGHEFVDPTEWGDSIPGVFCRKCLLMRRADGKNSPCPGPAKLDLRDLAAAEDNAPLSVGGLAMAVSGDRILHKVDFGYTYWCPGCETCHGIWTNRPNDLTGARWTMSGTEERPTFSPSIVVHAGNGDPHCHSFIRDGQIEFLSDSTHPLAGKTVPMEAF